VVLLNKCLVGRNVAKIFRVRFQLAALLSEQANSLFCGSVLASWL
jgi:hypothetical protein